MNLYDLDLSVDTLKALLWQYNEAKSLQELVKRKDAWTRKRQSEFWRNWLRDVFDIRTANDFGLMVWAIILDYRTFIELPGTVKENFGFGAFNLNFSNGNFGQQGSKSKFLSTAQKRLTNAQTSATP
jgi:hypothetical protein